MAVLCSAAGAHAQTAPRREPAPPPAAGAWHPVALPPPRVALDPNARDGRNYRGLARPVGAGEALLWVPRVVFAPLQLVTEYGLRRPVRAVVAGIESSHLPAYVGAVFSPTPSFSWMPSASFDFGFAPMFGAGFTWNHALVQGNQLRVVGTTGGLDYVDVSARDRITIGTVRLGVRGAYFDRPDRIFYGLGPYSQWANLSRYRRRFADAFALFDWLPTSHFQLNAEAGYRADSTGEGVRGMHIPGQPPPATITDRFDVQDPAMVPGFGPLNLFLAHGVVTLDSRRHITHTSGARLVVDATVGVDVFNQNQRFGVASALLEGAVELMHPGRVLVGSLYAADSQPFGSDPVPFTYLPTLGGTIHQGFRYGRFIGQSALVAEIDYRYPIWTRLDAVWMASVGNVFGQHFEGFRFDALTGSAGVGVRLRMDNSAPIEALVAFGSNRFDQPFGIEGVRLFLGVNRGL